MTDLTDLIARVEGATSADRELDGRLWELIDPRSSGPVASTRYTESLDAALALVERVLPGWAWHGGTEGYPGPAWARLFPGAGRMSEGTGDVTATTPALALLAALLKALQAQKEKGSSS